MPQTTAISRQFSVYESSPSVRKAKNNTLAIRQIHQRGFFCLESGAVGAMPLKLDIGRQQNGFEQEIQQA